MSWTGNWRLPTTPGTTTGYTAEGEMGHLFFTELGNPEGNLLYTDPFTDLQAKWYWLGTEYDADRAWDFWFRVGTQQDSGIKASNLFHAMAVRPGDLGASVPEPSTMILLGTGLIGLIGLRRKFRK